MNDSPQLEQIDKDRLVVIINPASGTVKSVKEGEEGFGDQVERLLRERGLEVEVRETTPEVGADVLARDAAAEGATHILVCGGDGTVMAAVNGLHEGKEEKAPGVEQEQAQAVGEPEKKPVLSIVPGGTANLLATALGIPSDIEGAIEVALAGVDRTIDLGRCHDHVFALGLGLGLTEKLVSKASAREKETLGKLAYAKAMLREIGAPPTRFRFKIDDGAEQTSRGVAIVVANAGEVGGKLQFAPDALMDDGVLDLCILHRFEVRDALRMAGKMLAGTLPEDRAVTFLQGKRIEILSEPPLDLQIDGEEVEESTPLVAEVIPNGLTVRVSPKADEKMDERIEEKLEPEKAAPFFTRSRLVFAGVVALAGAVTFLLKRRKN
jgi:diacylglycerol kinase (ATP)